MEKVKLTLVLLIILVALSLVVWGAYFVFSELGFWKSAVIVMIIEFFFATRGSYLESVEMRAYIEELRELRNLGNTERVKRGPLAIDVKLLGGSTASRALSAAAVTVISGAALLVFGLAACVTVVVICFLALLVRSKYLMKRRITEAHLELEDYRLTFLRNENSIIPKDK